MSESAENKNIIVMNAHQAALFMNVSYSVLAALKNSDNPPPMGEDKKFRSDTFGLWYRDYVIRSFMNQGSGRGRPVAVLSGIENLEDVYNPIQERARKDAEAADALALKNKQLRGELIPVAEIKPQFIELIKRAVTRLMGIPWSATPLLMGQDDPVKIHTILNDKMKDALREIASYD